MATFFAVFLVILASAAMVGAMTSPLWYDHFDAAHRQKRRINRGERILRDLRMLHDLDRESVVLPNSCVREIDDWIDSSSYYSNRYSTRRHGTYRELAKLMQELAYPTDLENPVLLPPQIQARAELWLIRHRRRVTGTIPLHQRAILRHHKALGR